MSTEYCPRSPLMTRIDHKGYFLEKLGKNKEESIKYCRETHSASVANFKNSQDVDTAVTIFGHQVGKWMPISILKTCFPNYKLRTKMYNNYNRITFKN